jgi:hypothetical protein
MMTQLEERVSAGIEKLNRRYGAGWIDKIVLADLKMWDINSCILGQLEGDYFSGMIKLGLNNEDAWTCGFTQWLQDRSRYTQDAFSFQGLNTTWQAAIINLRSDNERRVR